MVKRYVLTGAPGAGKTSILRSLQQRGWAVVEEAATDVIANEQAHGLDEPWRSDDFVDKIVTLQRHRQQQPTPAGVQVQFYDRSPFCSLALAQYLQHRTTATLSKEIARVMREQVYERLVFFVRPIGFVVPTVARRISYDDSVDFESVHDAVYREHGFEIVDVVAAAVDERAAAIESHVIQQTVTRADERRG